MRLYLIGIAAAAVAAFAIWALTIYGPSQYRAGQSAAEILLTAQTNKAIEELANDADKNRVRRRLCIERDGVFNFASGECKETDADQ